MQPYIPEVSTAPQYGYELQGQVVGYQPLPEERIIRMPPEYWRQVESSQDLQPQPQPEDPRWQQQEELLKQQILLQQYLEQQQAEQEKLQRELEQQQLDQQRLVPWVKPEGWSAPLPEVVQDNCGQGALLDLQWDGRGDEAVENSSNGQFLSLLDSLEARVDLMAQMQHTRVAIQNRARALEEMRARENEDTLARYEPSYAALQDPQQGGREAAEGTELWTYLADQRECIHQLTEEVQGMRNQMRLLQSGNAADSLAFGSPVENGGPPDRPRPPALGALDFPQDFEDSLQLQQPKVVDMEQELERQLEDERRQQVLAAQLRMQERSQLYAEISEAKRQSEARTGLDTLPTLLALPTSTVTEVSPPTIDLGRSLETQARDVGLPLGHQQPLDTAQIWTAPAPKLFGEPPLINPLNSDMCGVNVQLSEDGYTATRARGCRQSVAIGSGPLARQASGWYFEVVVQETVSGWVGGLGIGVTRTPPGSLPRVPDKAWRLPSTYIVGYWGCVFLDGMERKTQWRPDDLRAGQRVGFLVTGDGRGDIIVFVDDQPVVHVPGVMLAREMDGPASSVAVGVPEPMFPVVDVFAATRSVAMLKRATPPARPWDLSNPAVVPASPASELPGLSIGMS